LVPSCPRATLQVRLPHEAGRLSPTSGGAPGKSSSGLFSHDAPEADVASGRINRLRMARGGSVAAAVVGRAQVRAALENLARDPDLRMAGIVAAALRAAARVLGDAAWLRRVGGVLCRVPIARPLPDIADHVVEAIAVRRKGGHRRGALIAVHDEVLAGKLALPGVGQVPAARRELIAPRELRTI